MSRAFRRHTPSQAPSAVVRSLFEHAARRRMTLLDIAEAGLWSPAQVSHWKNGSVQPSILNTETLAQIVGVNLEVSPCGDSSSPSSGSA